MGGRKYSHCSIEERCEIARRRKAGESIRQIAAALDRSPSSVARELKRNSGSTGYAPRYAGEQAHARRWRGSRLLDRKSTRLNSSHVKISYAVFCLKKKKKKKRKQQA